MSDKAIRDLLGKALAWHDAHATFDDAVADIPAEARGRRPEHLPYSAWQLVEHLRITQRDILDFCLDAGLSGDEVAGRLLAVVAGAAVGRGVGRVESARTRRIARRCRSSRPIRASISRRRSRTASGQTYLRELVLVIDHSAYHVGQLVLVRRLLGLWKG